MLLNESQKAEREKELKKLFHKRNGILDSISKLEQERIEVTGEIWKIQDEMGTYKL